MFDNMNTMTNFNVNYNNSFAVMDERFENMDRDNNVDNNRDRNEDEETQSFLRKRYM